MVLITPYSPQVHSIQIYFAWNQLIVKLFISAGGGLPHLTTNMNPFVGLTPMRGERFPPVGVNNFLRPM